MRSRKPFSQHLQQKVVDLLGKNRSSDREEEGMAFQELKRLDKEQVIDILTDILINENNETELRCRSADTLIKLYHQRGARLIVPFLTSSDVTLRWVICGLLSNYGDEQVLEPLASVLLEDSDPGIRHLAAFALGKIGNQQSIPALKWVQQHDTGTDFEGRRVSDAATEAIERILARQ